MPCYENMLQVQILFPLTFTLRATQVRQPRLLKFLALTSMLLIQLSCPLSHMRISIHQEANLHVPLLPRCASFVLVVRHRSLSRTNLGKLEGPVGRYREFHLAASMQPVALLIVIRFLCVDTSVVGRNSSLSTWLLRNSDRYSRYEVNPLTKSYYTRAATIARAVVGKR